MTSATSSPASRCCAAPTSLPRSVALIKTTRESSTEATIWTNGGWSGACWPASSSTTAMPRTPTRSCATRRRRTAPIIALSSSSWPAGSRCAFCTIRHRHAHFAKIAESAATDLARAGAYWQGRAAEALGTGRKRNTLRGGRALFDRLLRPDRPRQAGLGELALHPLPGVRAPDLGDGSRTARAPENLYAIDARELACDDAGRSRRQDDGPRRADHPRRAYRNTTTPAPRSCSASPRSAAGCRSSTTHIPPRRAELPADRTEVEAPLVYSIVRQESCVQPEDGLERQRARPDAGDASGRPLHRQEIQRRLRPAAPAQRSVL